ncbi:MAG: MscL family protein [Candidatus Nitrosotenuis sp.]|nr:MAG: MscL family protein [Candidatus Nitrosotenuis sp.]
MSVSEKEKKGFIQEFMHFLQTFGVIGLAIAFVIGSAASKLVTALVTDIVNPLVGMALQDVGDLKKLSFTVFKSTFAYGDLIANVIDFLIIAVIVFILYKQLSKFKLVDDKTKS